MSAQDEPLNILIDPSILISKNAFEKFLMFKDKIDIPMKDYFVPASFKDVLSKAEANLDVIVYFRGMAKSVNLPYLREKLWEAKIKPFSPPLPYIEKYSEFYNNLFHNLKNEKIARILLEEWIFLQQKSIVISRIKKSFGEFIKAGAISIELGKSTFDYIVRKTIKKEKNFLTNIDRLRAVAKWIAVAGPPILPIENLLKELFGVSMGIFLLIDP